MNRLIEDQPKYIYQLGLRDAHAMETQAVQLLKRQVERLAHYPEIEARLRAHLTESERQRARLEEVLAATGDKPASMKEAVLGLGGSLAALSHAAASDEIIKNTLANYMFEHFEIATYQTLGEMAAFVGDQAGSACAAASLREEERMAAWLGEHLRPTARRYMEGIKAGAPVSR